MKAFTSFMVDNNNLGVTTKLTSLKLEDLPADDLLIKVAYSSINYKDYLATLNHSGVVATYPLVLGIDLCGTVVKSNSPDFQVGDKIIATSYDLGVAHFGGFSEYAAIKSEWAILLPQGLTLKESMLLGTAGFTAALACYALTHHPLEKTAAIAITGATGGVGSIATLLLDQLGYKNLTLLSQKPKLPYLQSLPHERILATNAFNEQKKKPLASQMFDGVVDTVGGELLSQLLPRIKYNGCVVALGNAGGITLNTTVLPFILRNITLQGIDSVHTPLSFRKEIWRWLSEEGKIDFKKLHYEEISLTDVPKAMTTFSEKNYYGRYLVAIGKED